MAKKFLFIAGHGKRKDGSFDTGAKGYITQGEHIYYRDTMFPLMKKYAPDNIIFHDKYNVYSHGNIVGLADSLGCNSVVEWHYDAWRPSASGGHVIVADEKTPNDIDKSIIRVIKKHIGLANRSHKGVYGADGRSDFYNPRTCQRYGKDYRMVELGFGTSKRDSKIMLENADAIAKDMIEVICGITVSGGPVTSTPILGEPTTTVGQMEQYAKNHKAPRYWIEMAELCFTCSVSYHVDPAVTWAQGCKETNFGKYTGVLTPEFKNTCGLKTRTGGGNYDPEAHQRFKTWEEGWRAHAQHLAWYAGRGPWKNHFDPRSFDSIKGTATSVEELGGKWAPALGYGKNVVERMNDLRSTEYSKVHSVDIKEKDVKKAEQKEETEEINTFDFGIAYGHANDRQSAEFLENVLLTRGYKVFSLHTEDMTHYDCDNIIQVGGKDVKGSTLKLIGKNEEETAKKVVEFLENNDLRKGI